MIITLFLILALLFFNALIQVILEEKGKKDFWEGQDKDWERYKKELKLNKYEEIEVKKEKWEEI